MRCNAILRVRADDSWIVCLMEHDDPQHQHTTKPTQHRPATVEEVLRGQTAEQMDEMAYALDGPRSEEWRNRVRFAAEGARVIHGNRAVKAVTKLAKKGQPYAEFWQDVLAVLTEQDPTKPVKGD